MPTHRGQPLYRQLLSCLAVLFAWFGLNAAPHAADAQAPAQKPAATPSAAPTPSPTPAPSPTLPAQESGQAATPALQPSATTSFDASGTPETLPEDPKERDKEARSQFEQGRVAYEDGRYRDAWGYFHRSYKLSNRPELLYNIGQTADRLGMDSDALKAFNMYLQHLPNAANRREVENRVKALEDRVKQRGGDASSEPAAPGEAATTDADKPPEAPPAPPPNNNGQPSRQGWYFRAALGVGLRRDGVSDKSLDASVSGGGFSGELSVAATVLHGVALGGGLFFDWTGSPTLSLKGSPDVDIDSANLTMLGAVADWYLAPETDGWHFQGALGLALLGKMLSSATSTNVPIGTKTASGVGLILGGGYEWPIENDWAFGVMGRLTFAGLSEETRSHGFFALSVLATVTWF